MPTMTMSFSPSVSQMPRRVCCAHVHAIEGRGETNANLRYSELTIVTCGEHRYNPQQHGRVPSSPLAPTTKKGGRSILRSYTASPPCHPFRIPPKKATHVPFPIPPRQFECGRQLLIHNRVRSPGSVSRKKKEKKKKKMH